MRGEEVREKRTEELRELEKELAAKLFNLRYRSKTTTEGDVRQFREVRKDIARVKTELRLRELARRAEENSRAAKQLESAKSRARRNRARRPQRKKRQIT